MLDQRDLTGASLATAIQRLASDPARRDSLAQHARALARPAAAQAIVARIVELAEGHQQDGVQRC
jgi:UDP-N-acetylglucosamine:LPS N-acetylglucosamine transferase